MYKLKDLLENIEYTSDREISDEMLVTDMITDSREVTPKSMFICLKGCKSDGHNYIKEAEKRGAEIIVCNKKCLYKSEKAIRIYVDDPRKTYGKIWRNASKNPDKRIKIIAVTGTNGKTTVSTMIFTALNSVGRRCALIGTLGGYFEGEKTSVDTMTTPDPEKLYPLIKRYADLGAEYAVMEASSHALALGKLDGMEFFVGAVTNLTPEHLDFHGNMKEYYRAKASLFDKCEKKLFCIDDSYIKNMYENSKGEKKCVSIRDTDADYYADNIYLDGIRGVSFDLNFKGGKTNIKSDIPREFTVSNALLAAAVLKELGLSLNEIKSGIYALHGVNGRMERLPTCGDFSVFIDFAHTPDALQKLLETVNQFKKNGQRTVTLFGCGGDRDRSKRSLMGAIASRLSDFVIITGDNSRSENKEAIINDILSGFDKKCPHTVIYDRKEAISFAVENADKGDIILLCGKGHEEYEIDEKGTHPFSERQIVYDVLAKKAGKP